MTQQEINTYFRDNGYTEDPENNFVDPTGQFTFFTGSIQLLYTYPEYEAVIKNDFITDVQYLESWISAVEEDSQNPPTI